MSTAIDVAVARAESETLMRQFDKPLRDCADAAYQEVSQVAARRRSLPVIQAAVDRASGRAAQLAADIRAAGAPLACAPGCAHCCYTRVVVGPIEALRIADWARRNLSAPDLAQLLARVRAADDQTRGLNDSARAALRRPCALLGEDSRCDVYTARPAVCRGCNARDANDCRDGLDHPNRPVRANTALHRAYVETSAAVAVALDASRLGPVSVELHAALRLALEDPNLAQRWLTVGAAAWRSAEPA